ncbi:hypothetical protein [Aquimarina sediminis]|uniref:hypothetical protein n=1 Tax=Aquimarina sediminis TaxID=2070536 RepID=UPI0013E8A82F|nr:hypothetical protein [Aquimarina sediminis]
MKKLKLEKLNITKLQRIESFIIKGGDTTGAEKSRFALCKPGGHGTNGTNQD